MLKNNILLKFKYFLIFIFILLFSISCTITKAKNEYDKGKYIESIETILEYLDKNPKKVETIKQKKYEDEISNKFQHIIDYYSTISENNDYNIETLKANSALVKIHLLLESRNYTKQLPIINNFLDSNNFKHYYSNVEKITDTLFINFLNNSNNYKDSLNILNYINDIEREINNLYLKNPNSKFKNEYIDIKKQIENKKSNLYNKYGLHTYHLGVNEIKNSTSKKSYRKAYFYFLETQKYIPNYNNINTLIEESKNKGFFKYSIVGNSNVYNNLINDKFKKIGILTNSNLSQLTIKYDENSYYYISNPIVNVEHLVKKEKVGMDSDGNFVYKEYHFKKITTIQKEYIKLNYSIFANAPSVYNNSINDYIVMEFPIENIRYEGNVPHSISNEYININNRPLGRLEVLEKVHNKLKPKIENIINTFVNDLGEI